MQATANLVSIIIPNYNSERYIEDTVISVCAQTHTEWELLIVDDYSSDGSMAILERLAKADARIRLIRLDAPSGGPARPRNVGLDAARGDYIAFLDSDDVWHPQKLEIQLATLLQRGASFCSTTITRFQTTEEILPFQQTPFNIAETLASMTVQEIPHSVLIKKNIIPNSSVFLERRLLTTIRFNEDKRYKAIEDFDCWLRVLQQHGGVCIKISPTLLFYRVTETSISHTKTAMVRKHWMLYQEYRINGRPLGLEKIWYMWVYAFSSITNLLGLRITNTLDHVTPTTKLP
ncbi:MAG: glycosyltransferase family 2 protein [Candidatus Kapaibacteriota bacterium]